TADSTIDRLEYKPSRVRTFIQSLTNVDHVLVDLKTNSGKNLSLTPNHPVLLASGTMVEAEVLRVGDLLLQADGTPDEIVSAQSTQFYGKVYNLYVESDYPLENIVVTEGILNGSAFFQNKGLSMLNR